jgi:hypothetical protein
MSTSIYQIISRPEAKEQGLKRYFTGKACKHGHITERWTVGGDCVGCRLVTTKNIDQPPTVSRKEYNKKWRIDNPEKAKKFYNNNKEYYKQCNVNWVNNNKEKYCQYQKDYKVLNPDKTFLYGRLRRSKLTKTKTNWIGENQLIKQLYQKRDELNKLWGTNLQVDHIIPLTSDTVSGLHCWSNLQLLEGSINSSKSNTYQTDW